jgi:phosphoribosyl-dephospho-CoA transferase
MGFRTHDIIKINFGLVKGLTPLPLWVSESLCRSPYVVVRREQASFGWIPAGVRGSVRGQRFALMVPRDAIEFSISPEALVQDSGSVDDHFQRAACFRALADFEELGQQYKLCWGPIGSVGFELATFMEVTHPKSDLDVIVRLKAMPQVSTLRNLLRSTKRLETNVDVLLESEQGAVCLAEYVASPQQTLIRTTSGPCLGIFSA